MLRKLRDLIQSAATPLLRAASRAYVPGPHLDDALTLARQLEAQGLRATIGYFNSDDDAPDLIAGHDLAAIDAATTLKHPAYVSIKAPPMLYDLNRIGMLARLARQHGQWLHFDSHGPETAAPTLRLMEALRDEHPRLGLTIPGRWVRSVRDAEWAIAHGVRVRVVKGQWACPDKPNMDQSAGFMAVIDQLAGRAVEVAVASHDAQLVRQALQRLQQAGTPCELELLCGLPRHEVMAVARELGVPVRFYVPFGTAWLPYALGQLLRQPRMWGWMLKDLLVSYRLR
ncbi:MAG TPA: hypothetical protein VFW93_18165 [Aquabacterium sp.]|uniref:hypothetical protein n=1 Tax=Aquabacterium sp. TaxID=1872578 RepID=UPI002E2FE769|nr:hypothetical protein [Aquabacterium sp.]HEX5358133.1 hypothetical protein [Aquabacterium sp.]